MYRFEKYTNENEREWDCFIEEKTANGSFLNSRRFLNYHPEGRFEDNSLVVYDDKERIIAVIPGNVVEENGEKHFFSHKGSTFGGILIDRKKYCGKYVIPLVNELKTFLLSNYDVSTIKFPTDILSEKTTALFQYAFQQAGYEERKELNTYIDYSTYKESVLTNFSQGKRTNVHNCEKNGFQFREVEAEEDINSFYELLCENLDKYDTKPVHTLDELIEFKNSRLKKECGFYGVYDDEKMISGAMMFYFEKTKVAHTQYLAASQYYNKLSPMTFLYYSLIMEMKKNGFKYLSWGIVTEELGQYLNMGLLSSKEDFGSSYCNNLTYIVKRG